MNLPEPSTTRAVAQVQARAAQVQAQAQAAQVQAQAAAQVQMEAAAQVQVQVQAAVRVAVAAPSAMGVTARGVAPSARPSTGGKRRRSRGVAARPGWAHERTMWSGGHRLVAGVDEVGRGAWAGPLSVGVAVLDDSPRRIPRGLRDSKQLTEEVRESIFDNVAGWCAGWAVGHAGPEECDRWGMTAALRLATRRAFGQLPPDLVPDAVVLDGTFDYVSPPAAPTLFDADGTPYAVSTEEATGELTLGVPGLDSSWAPPVETVVKGDARCASVAAASVLAKVTRDRIMRATAAWYPPFDFDRNKGYPSPAHQRALCGYGLSAAHRRSWAFVDNLPWGLRAWPAGGRLHADEARADPELDDGA